jgi:hypothetical protein
MSYQAQLIQLALSSWLQGFRVHQDISVNIPNDLSWEREVLSNGLIVLLYPKSSALTG